MSRLSEDCGRLFEVGFNCGLLTCVRQQEKRRMLTHRVGSLYQCDLERLRFTPMAEYAIKRAKTIGPSPTLRRVAEQVLLSFAFKGFLTGLHFFEEFLKALGSPYEGGLLHVRHIQCSFREQNSLGRIPIDPTEDKLALRRCLEQLDPDLGSASLDLDLYSKKGRFLKADTLLLLQWGGDEDPAYRKKTAADFSQRKWGKKQEHEYELADHSLEKGDLRPAPLLPRHWRIVCCDLSIHSITHERLRDPNDITSLRQILLSELNYLRSRGVFSNLNFHVEQGMPENLFADGLETYLTAFKKEDKESAKLIQAGGYAYDFYALLCERGMIRPQDDLVCHAFGVTDRGINSMNVTREHMRLLQTCQTIYQRDPSDETIDRARDDVVQTIRSNAGRSFEGAGPLLDAFMAIDTHADGCFWLPSHQETEPVLSPQDPLPLDRVAPALLEQLGGRANAGQLTIQQSHTLLVQRALASRDPYLFLTGNPGIGKTWAIVDFLKECERRGEGFLFFYVSPRKQVNLDLMDKFREYEGGPIIGSVLAITTSATLLEGRDEPTVAYLSSQLRGPITHQGVKTLVHFLEAESEEIQPGQNRSRRIASLLEDQIWDHGERTVGVLNSICQALAANMQDPLSQAMVATLSIQALKKRQGANDTLTHLDKIFASARVGTRGRVLPDRMCELAARIPHLFFMVDEVTGDESGVAFLAGLHTFAQNYGLFDPSSPFHTKIIVADASIVDQSVIDRHLRSSSYEPEKIYFQHVRDLSLLTPLSQRAFDFKNQAALQLNANTYPARNLHLAYHVCVECVEFQEYTTQLPQSKLTPTVQERMCEDLVQLLAQGPTAVPQVLVYIQDKGRLANLIALLKKRLGSFEPEVDYLEIHANISDSARKTAERLRKSIRVVFMTASASRGLSFPEATHFLVDVPRFEIEMNTMEILQVIYRGRGGTRDLQDKYVQFYLSDRTFYYRREDRARSLRESVLGLLNMLLILKTSMMTRITGAGRIGRHHYMMIPIGGKSVSTAGGTFVDTMADLIGQLQSEIRIHPERQDFRRVAEHLQQLFGEGVFRWEQGSAPPTRLPYLPMRTGLIRQFHDRVATGFHSLLEWPELELAYVTGGLIVVPTHQKKLDQNYLFDLRKRFRTQQGQETLRLLWHLAKEPKLPDQMRNDLNKAKDLFARLEASPDEKTQRFLQSSQFADQYYAVPFMAFFVPEVFEDYFASMQDSLNLLPFRLLIERLVRTWYPADATLPIGADYRTFPFVVFRSYNLEEVRHRIFAGTSLFVSYDLNVLNMLLSTRERTTSSELR
jgi:hypothetical protein